MTKKPSSQHFQEKMQDLRRDYLNRLKKNLRDVRRLKELLLKDMAPARDLQELSRLAHNLSGSGATFGFPDISLKAGNLHATLKELLDTSQFSRLSKAACEAVITNIDAFYEISRQTINRYSLAEIAASDWSASPTTSPVETTKVIAILARKDNVLCKKIRTLAHSRILHASNFEALAAMEKIDLLIISNDLTSADETYLQDLLDRHQALPSKTPFLVALPQNDLQARFDAMQLGAQGYFDCDMDAEPLAALILTAVSRPSLSGLTGAVISKDVMLNGFYEHALQQLGVKTHSVTPRDFIGTIAETDFFIVDFETPWGKGVDFITLLHQERKAQAIIFFLCTKDEYNSLDVVPSCITLLLKPFAPDYLIKILGKTLPSLVQLRR